MSAEEVARTALAIAVVAVLAITALAIAALVTAALFITALVTAAPGVGACVDVAASAPRIGTPVGPLPMPAAQRVGPTQSSST